MPSLKIIVTIFCSLLWVRVALCGPPGSGDAHFFHLDKDGKFVPDPAAQARHKEQQKKRGRPILRANKGLPIASDLPDWNVERPDDINNFRAQRREDETEIEVTILAFANPEAVTYMTRQMAWATDNTRSSWPQGSPSGKPIGQKSWEGAGISYVLQVQDGPSTINLRISPKISADPETKKPMWKPITKNDRLLVEHIARVMLKRLKTLHLTHDTFKP